MIDWWKWDAESCRFSVVLSPRMAPLFEDEDYTLLVNAQRQRLGKDLARWLHGYWSSHKQIYPIYDATLMRLCGAETEAIWKFRQLLREALAELEGAGFWHPVGRSIATAGSRRPRSPKPKRWTSHAKNSTFHRVVDPPLMDSGRVSACIAGRFHG